jgi:osomolarity two-component system, response regulator SKN7
MMPQLDGVAATTIIRQFDSRTPIISMTGNSKPNEIVSYFNSGELDFGMPLHCSHQWIPNAGMNDILPKPFTKEGLIEMLKV